MHAFAYIQAIFFGTCYVNVDVLCGEKPTVFSVFLFNVPLKGTWYFCEEIKLKLSLWLGT